MRERFWRSSALFVLAISGMARADEPFRAGFGEAEFTPQAGYRMAGGYGERISEGVHDPLKVKAVIFERGERRAALAVFDIGGVFPELSGPIRLWASDALGVGDAISVCATHTHGGPEYGGVLRDVFHARAIADHGRDPHEPADLNARMIVAAKAALGSARDSLRPVTLEVGRATCDGLAFNRRFHMKEGPVRFNPGKQNPEIVGPAGPTDPDLPFVLVRSADDGTPIGSLTTFAMHTAVWGGAEFSADFPGVLARRLGERFGPGFVSLFLEGTAGDVNHFNVSTDAADPDSEAVGTRLEQAIGSILPNLEPVERPSLGVGSASVANPIQIFSPERIDAANALLRDLDRREDPFLVTVDAWRVHYADHYRRLHGDSMPMHARAIRLGTNLAIVTLPHEVFVEIGLEIKRRSPFRHTMVVSLADDMDFYIPTRKAFGEGSYEVTTCPLEPGFGEAAVEVALRSLEMVRP